MRDAPHVRGQARWQRVRHALSPSEWRTVGLMAAVVIGLHVAGFVLLFALVVPHHYRLGASGAFAIGTGVTAYTLGMRHAFDADHIAAIDNTTRKLMSEGKRPMSVGFWFSLGHSTIVFALAFAALGRHPRARRPGARRRLDAAQRHQLDRDRRLRRLPLPDRSAQHRDPRRHRPRLPRDAQRPATTRPRSRRSSNARGLMNRFFGRFTRTITRPWQMYPLGVLFGLGFDTATEVALLFLAAGAAGAGLPFYAILCLPILFAAGMSLLDTIDGSFMNFAYGWAFSKPVRKVFYNLTITGLSVAVALVIGTDRARRPRRLSSST